MYKFNTEGLSIKWNVLVVGQPQPFLIINNEIVPLIGLELGPDIMGMDQFMRTLNIEYSDATVNEISKRLEEVVEPMNMI